MNPIAIELNNAIQKVAPSVYDMLSVLGQNMFMPKGIITQSAQAKEKAHKFNATIGTATIGKDPMHLSCIYKHFKEFAPADIFNYAPTAGQPNLRKVWKEKMIKENPGLNGKKFGLPIATAALTHGTSIVADLFCNEGDYVITPDQFWGNYRLTFSVLKGGLIATFPTFTEQGGFNVDAMLAKVEECGKLRPKVIVLLNFPNNPTGYTPTVEEAKKMAEGLKNIADSGVKVIAVVDDAYFGMFYWNSIKESLFPSLCQLSPNLLPIKLDGPTKEMFVWGFRVGFITFGATTENDESPMFEAMEKKVSGNIRGVISNVPQPSQTVIAAALKDPNFEKERDKNFDILRERAEMCRKVLANPKYSDQWSAYPFNSGYFLCLKLTNVEAEPLRIYLLDKYGVGTISTGKKDLRIAFSCIEAEDVEELFDIIYKGCQELASQ